MASTNFSIIFVFSFFMLVLGLLSLITTTEAAVEYLYHICPNTTTFTPNSTYQTNLNHLLSSLSSNSTRSTTNGFYNTTAGGSPAETIYGLFLCRGDVSTEVCQECVSTAAEDVFRQCPIQKVSVIWYAECMVRYSNQSIFGTVTEVPSISLLNSQNITEQERFNQLLADTMVVTMADLVSEAANDQTAGKKFAVKQANFSGFQTLYTLAQCTPDLTVSECNTCLAGAVGNLPNCCGGKQGGRVLTPSCNARYEVYPFYNLTSTASPPPPPPPALVPPPAPTTTGKGSSSLPVIVVPVVAAVAVLLLFGIWFCLCRVKLENNSQQCPQFKLEVVCAATQHFSDENLLGKGGFGQVYKGTLADGREIAVKRLSRNSQQGPLEFNNEVNIIANLQHRNLVKLLGCCIERNESMLIYEYMPNKSLDVFLFADLKGGIQLDWRQRLVIINGIARGLLYLHEDSRLRIIHLDLKASNVLLDHEMNPKISDFGLARLFDGNQIEANTTKIAGSRGYMAPEYLSEGLISVKSDVFSCGVLLLEIISGHMNYKFHLSQPDHNLLTYAWKLWSDGQGLDLIDPILEQSCVPAEVLKCIQIGLLCVQQDPAARPTMLSVVNMLSNDTGTLPQPRQPTHYFASLVAGPSQSTQVFSANKVTMTTLSPR